ncbi:hypothetical protein ACFL5X_02440 [Candidatus Omnitrophota bacterium]
MRKAQALIVVIAILAVLLVIGLSLLLLTIYEVRHSRTYLDGIKAQYLAEAGAVVGSRLVAKDAEGNIIDSLEDELYTVISGTDADVNGDGQNESRWFFVQDSQGEDYGRFAVSVLDEASKLNLNYCGEGSVLRRGESFEEIDVDALLSALGIAKSGSLEASRFGADGMPGEAGFDDDSDGEVDEFDEQGSGDDRLFLASEQAQDLLTVPQAVRFKDYFTVYSKDRELDLWGNIKVHVNSRSVADVALNFLRSGMSLQRAANFIDYQDTDLVQTVVDKFSFSLNLPTPTGGGFVRFGGYLRASPGSGGASFVFENLGIADGDYYCFFHSPFKGTPVGYVSSGEIENIDVYSGEGLPQPVKVSSGAFSVRIEPFDDQECYVQSLELVSLNMNPTLVHIPIRGREPLVINEVMPKPSFTLAAYQAQDPKGSWNWGGMFFSNADFGSGQSGEGKWVFDVNKSGYFHVILLAGNPGGYIGDVEVSGRHLSDARDGMRLPLSVYVADKLTVSIQNTSLMEVATFRGVILSQEPDSEYVEILNLSPESIDISGFSLEVAPKAGSSLGWPAVLPEGTQIGPFQHLVLAVDSADSDAPSFLNGNGISFQRTWSQPSVQLQFSGAVEGNDDIVPNQEAVIILRDAQGRVTAAVEYKASQVSDFVSIERGDPTLFTDSDGNGYFEGWYFSEDLAKGTPSRRNDNPGIKEIDPVTLEVFYHDPSEQSVENKPFINIGYADAIPSGRPWEKSDARDVALLADRFTSSRRLLGFGSSVGGSFSEEGGGYSSSGKDETGAWSWPGIAQGAYILKILADAQPPAAISVAVGLDGEMSSYLGPFSFDEGVVRYGTIEVAHPSQTLEIDLRNEADALVTIKNFVLEPQFQVRGRININTAGPKVLGALTSSSTASNLIAGRPFGQKSGRRSGIGDALSYIGLAAFRLIEPFITVRSDVFEVLSLAEYTAGQRVTTHRIETIIER